MEAPIVHLATAHRVLDERAREFLRHAPCLSDPSIDGRSIAPTLISYTSWSTSLPNPVIGACGHFVSSPAWRSGAASPARCWPNIDAP
ncbi:MAG TPA: hypothetical protein VK524_32575 [Polyangiaceae bacterium]|nr:hypothetical protein [Polyangiaceae bacterium]